MDSFISRFKGEFKNKFDLDWIVLPYKAEQMPSQLFSKLENNSSDMFDQNLSTISIANNDDEFYSIPDN